jgi:hypothetical protein
MNGVLLSAAILILAGVVLFGAGSPRLAAVGKVFTLTVYMALDGDWVQSLTAPGLLLAALLAAYWILLLLRTHERWLAPVILSQAAQMAIQGLVVLKVVAVPAASIWVAVIVLFQVVVILGVSVVRLRLGPRRSLPIAVDVAVLRSDRPRDL